MKWIFVEIRIFGLLFAVLVAGCGGRAEWIPAATPEMAEAMGVDQAELVHGRELYMTHCARCHNRVKPGKLDPEYWRGTLPHMAEHAKLTAGDELHLLIYLMAAHGTVHGGDLEH